MGTPAQFAAMVSTCHTAGVKVYVDAVLNHMAAQSGSGTSFGGQAYNPSTLTYPSYSSVDFHHYPANCPESSNSIDNWLNYTDVTQCQLEGLPDLATETTHVRTTQAAYLNSLISARRGRVPARLGVEHRRDRHRRDGGTAAPGHPHRRPGLHHPGGLPGQRRPGRPAEPGVVRTRGQRHLVRLLLRVEQRLREQQHRRAQHVQPAAAERLRLVVRDQPRHRTRRPRPCTTPTVPSTRWPTSSCSRTDTGHRRSTPASRTAAPTRDRRPTAPATSPTRSAARAPGSAPSRLPGIVAMVGWHNLALTNNDPVTNWTTAGNNVVAFSRGSDAWIAINNSASPVTGTFPTGLANGSYCDIVHHTISGSACSGPVDHGRPAASPRSPSRPSTRSPSTSTTWSPRPHRRRPRRTWPSARR